MKEEQRDKLKNLKKRIIALIPEWGLYAILKTFLDRIGACQNENEIDGKIKQLEILVQDAENFIKNMNACIQKNVTALVTKYNNSDQPPPPPPPLSPLSPSPRSQPPKKNKGKGK